MKRQNLKYYISGGVALVTFIVYLASLRNSFVFWDDEYYVLENPHIRYFDLAFLKWAFFDFYSSNWHPLTWMSHALDYAVWGLNPLGHHLTNNILHAANTFLVVLLVAKLLEQQLSSRVGKWSSDTAQQLNNSTSPFTFHDSRFILIAAGVTGLLFGLHPIHVESVAWVAERKDLLCALFYLLSIMMYTKYAVTTSTTFRQVFNKHYLLSLGFFILALLSKPMAVSLPVVLLLLDWYPFQRITSLKTFKTALVEKVPFIAFSLISSILTVLAQKAGGSLATMEIVPLSTRMLVAVKSFIAYLWKMILPLHLVPYYPYPNDVSFFSVEHLAGIILAAALTAICIVMAKRRKLFLSAWMYYVVTLGPVLGIVQVGGQSMADRYTYLPGLGPFLVMGLMIAWSTEKISRRTPAIKYPAAAVGVFLLAAMSLLTWKQIGVWENSLTLWTYVIEKEPARISIAYNNRGMAFLTMGDIERAIEDYQRAVAQDPRYAEAHSNLGVALSKKGLLDDAIREFQTAIRLSPEFANAHRNLAPALYQSGRVAEALEQYIIVTKLLPYDARAHADLGSVYGTAGSYDKAIEHFQIALRLRPDLADTHYNLGIAYQRKGLIDQAVEHLEAAARLDPADASIRDALAEVYERKNSPATP